VDGHAALIPSRVAGRASCRWRALGGRAATASLALALASLCSWPATASAQAPAPARPPDIFFVPTPHAVADRMLQLAGVTAPDVVYDLGSGDGRLLVIAAQKYGARGVGIEIDPALVARSREIAREGGVADRVRIVEGDLFAADVSEATVVTLYLSTRLTRALEPKLRAELRPGARIVSHQFRLGTWAPDEHVTVDGRDLYLWRVPPGRR
jgi:SAM-dependent methyltransferase